MDRTTGCLVIVRILKGEGLIVARLTCLAYRDVRDAGITATLAEVEGYGVTNKGRHEVVDGPSSSRRPCLAGRRSISPSSLNDYL